MTQTQDKESRRDALQKAADEAYSVELLRAYHELANPNVVSEIIDDLKAALAQNESDKVRIEQLSAKLKELYGDRHEFQRTYKVQFHNGCGGIIQIEVAEKFVTQDDFSLLLHELQAASVRALEKTGTFPNKASWAVHSCETSL